jgi:hypothetical protein
LGIFTQASGAIRRLFEATLESIPIECSPTDGFEWLTGPLWHRN